MDLRPTDRLALRLVQADYFSTWIAEERGDLVRLSTGPSYAFENCAVVPADNLPFSRRRSAEHGTAADLAHPSLVEGP